MNKDTKKEIAEKMFMQMLRLLLSTNKNNDISDEDKLLIAHNVLMNLLGAYFAGIARISGFSDDLMYEAMDELIKDAKSTFLKWRRKQEDE